MSRLFHASIKENTQLIENHYLLTLHPLRKIIRPKPGQFFMLLINGRTDPLLRRPFSLFRWLDGDFQLIYRIIGKATKILKDKKSGDILDIIGPLGNGFPMIKRKETPILIGGGLGVVALFALAEKIKDKDIIFFIGAKTKDELLCIKELKSLGINPIISTDDGSYGKKGVITDVFKRFLTRYSILRHCFYACGPKPMLQELSHISVKYSFRGYIALEESMACGVGACLSCVVNTRNGYKCVCKEGPVFPVEEIVW